MHGWPAGPASKQEDNSRFRDCSQPAWQVQPDLGSSTSNDQIPPPEACQSPNIFHASIKWHLKDPSTKESSEDPTLRTHTHPLHVHTILTNHPQGPLLVCCVFVLECSLGSGLGLKKMHASSSQGIAKQCVRAKGAP